jgi:hypothetical protein
VAGWLPGWINIRYSGIFFALSFALNVWSFAPCLGLGWLAEALLLWLALGLGALLLLERNPPLFEVLEIAWLWKETWP